MRRAILHAEALSLLALASVLIAAVPFRWIATFASRGRQGRAATPTEARTMARAVAIWGRRVPWRAVCFQRGLAIVLMLRRRRLAARLYYGARRIDGRLVAHVWVRSGATDVIGCEDVSAYGLLAVFPAI